MYKEARDTSTGLRTGARMRTKLASITLSTKRKFKSKFAPLVYLLT